MKQKTVEVKLKQGLEAVMNAKFPGKTVIFPNAPDMPLNGFQGQPNRPEQVARVFDALCELRAEPAPTIEAAVLANTKSLFSALAG